LTSLKFRERGEHTTRRNTGIRIERCKVIHSHIICWIIADITR
jgi:hypothetical protein